MGTAALDLVTVTGGNCVRVFPSHFPMWFSQLLLLLAAAKGPPLVALAPAPGASPANSIVVSGRAVVLDAEGRGVYPAGGEPSATGFRFYRMPADGSNVERVFYYPAGNTLVAWPLEVEGGGSADVVAKDHDSDSWGKGLTFSAPIERADESKRIRFVLPGGRWDLAVLIRGYAPAFAENVEAYSPSQSLGASKPSPAARLKARILDVRGGRTPERWSAFVRRASVGGERAEARFFATRPVAIDRETLDFASLPTGEWKLQVSAPGRMQQERSVDASNPASIDLGDVLLSLSGSIRVTLVFPMEVPPGDFELRLQSVPPDREEEPVELDGKTVRPRSETLVVFEEVGQELVLLESENRWSSIRHDEFVHVASGQATEVTITLAPLRLQGSVKQGDQPVAEAMVRARVAELPERELLATTDDFGRYSMQFWTTEDAILLWTTAPGDQLPLSEVVWIEPEMAEIEHDIVLSAGEIRGTVRDADTGEVLKGADIHYSASIPGPTENILRDDFAMGNSSDRDGRFRMGSLPLKPVEVEVKREGYSPALFPRVQPTPEGTELDVRLEKGFRLVGTVLDESGAPLSGVNVGLDPDRLSLYFSRQASTSTEGEFEFGSIGQGQHVLGISLCGYTLVLRTVAIEPSDSGEREKRVQIQLVRELAPIPVHFEDENGAPSEHPAVQWMVDDIVFPLGDSKVHLCDRTSSPDAEGNMMLRGFPYGTISAVTLAPERRPLGTYTNDGSQIGWTIRLPKLPQAESPGNNP